jgi:hypothetical protein
MHGFGNRPVASELHAHDYRAGNTRGNLLPKFATTCLGRRGRSLTEGTGVARRGRERRKVLGKASRWL